MMVEATIVKQVADVLAPALPYLAGPAAAAGQKAAEIAKSKLGEEKWNKATRIWDKIRPEVEKKPVAAEALKEVAANPDDDIAISALPASLRKLLEGMPPETIDEIRSIVSVSRSETYNVHAESGGVAAGRDIHGGVNIGKS
jgi:hypothetical protein